MPGPPPKAAATRQRRNKKATAAQLVPDPQAEVPVLPANPPQDAWEEALGLPVPEWHPAVRDEWTEIWRSAMASQYGPVEAHGLLKLMCLVQAFWTTSNPELRKQLHAEIRIARTDFGLTPKARASLHWEVAQAEDAVERRVERTRGRSQPTPEEELEALR